VSAGFAFVYAFILIVTTMNPWFLALLVMRVFTISNTAANALIQTSASSCVLGPHGDARDAGRHLYWSVTHRRCG
jgi:hypothetical protein